MTKRHVIFNSRRSVALAASLRNIILLVYSKHNHATPTHDAEIFYIHFLALIVLSPVLSKKLVFHMEILVHFSESQCIYSLP